MKIQHLAIIFVIIMLPVSIVVGSYIQAQIDTITLQTEYDNKLLTATYDAIRSFQLNTINNKYSTINDSKIRDIEASISSFYNSLGTELGATGYSAEELKEFIPAILYTMYDGYYIYGEYYNDIKGDYQYSLRPYVYYSCRYKKGNNDFVVNYTLDNTITIYGIVNGEYVAKTGTLINPNNVSNIRVEENGNAISLTYRGVTIEREILTEQLITLDDNSNAICEEYEYTIYNNRKIYKDNTGYFWNDDNKKQYIADNDTLRYIDIMTENGHLYCNSAAQYYKNAYEFSTWVNDNLKNITQQDAIDSDGNPITDFSVDTATEEIFLLGKDNDPEEQGSTFQENRISVIRKSIISNLSTAIANFNTSSNTYEFVMPVFKEEDWEKITNNISVATFMQGIPIGSKYYNNYCIITNDKNKEFISKDSIYVITEDGQVHLPTCKKVLEENKKVVQAYNNVDFERQTVASETIKVPGEENPVKEVYFYPHANERCYYCMVDSTKTYSIDNIIQGEVKQYNKNKDEYEIDTVASNRLNTTNLRKDYIIALARKRYELYRNIEAENRKYTYRVKPIILSVNSTPISATIRAVGEVNDIVGYAVTETSVPPTDFIPCDSKQNITVTVGGLTPNKTYYAWVKDDEGNINDIKEFTTKQLGNIIFQVIPDGWTKENVIVTATLTDGDLALQTSKDGITWQDTTNQLFEQNGTMWARVRDYTSKIASIQITNIDKIAPIITKIEATTNSATITATDQNGSGISGYAITTTNTEPSSEFQESNVFENLKQNTTYYVWVKDVVGNVSEGKPFKTEQVIAGSRNIRFTIDPNTWTNGNVTVTAVTDVTGFTLETSINAETWAKQNTQVLTENGIVYARLVDSTNQYNGIASIEITIIDKIKPVIEEVIPEANSATIIATDEASGIVGYALTTSTSEPSSFNMLTSSTKDMNINVTELEDNTTYYVWVKDAAGNISESQQFKTKIAARLVTYYIDTNDKREENVKIGQTCLSPTTFTPEKDGYTFVGWREDGSATPDVLSDKIMGQSPVTLYAVFKQDVIVTYYNNSTTASVESKVKYYNNGNVVNPRFTITQASKSGCIPRGWGTSRTGNILYNVISDTEISSSITLYGIYELIQKEWSYGYTGGIQTFVVPITGTYQLEVWGAQGGAWRKTEEGYYPEYNTWEKYPDGGKGGYATGYVTLTEGTILYICAGGTATRNTVDTYDDDGETFYSPAWSLAQGGYNGGGNAAPLLGGNAGGGGGATHIATANGVLKDLYNNRNSVLIVAGGGGGSAWYSTYDYQDDEDEVTSSYGGAGGGLVGGNGTSLVGDSYYGQGIGGGQDVFEARYEINSDGWDYWTRGFGQGGGEGTRLKPDSWTGSGYRNIAGGGGGGWMGGEEGGYYSAGGGGSSYIGGVTSGSTESGINTGDGKAKIKFISLN